jgi:hypothetical protein
MSLIDSMEVASCMTTEINHRLSSKNTLRIIFSLLNIRAVDGLIVVCVCVCKCLIDTLGQDMRSVQYLKCVYKVKIG